MTCICIARSLMKLMGGNFELYVDGDLFKVELEFPELKDSSAADS